MGLKWRFVGATACLSAAILSFAATDHAQAQAKQPEISFGLPAIPPVFVGVQAMVAEKQGFFKKYGLDVRLRNFANGAEGSRAVVSADIDASLSPTPLIINQISNADINFVGIYGNEHPDYYLASLDPNATCKSLVGQPVGVDAPGGALSIALKIMLASCGVTIDQVQQVSLSANVPTAMIGGQLKHAVLHLDGIMAVENQTGKPVKTIIDYESVHPVYHNMMVVVRRDKLAANRDIYVRLIAGMIDAERYMRDPANRDVVAKIAMATGRTEKEAARALDSYIKMEFWPHGNAGLGQANIEAVEKDQKAAGNIRAGKNPAPYGRVVDLSIYADALALVNKRS
jgi:ABC-type nitrate/sulfonate/bicarbonate transport system substrate-binding protein